MARVVDEWTDGVMASNLPTGAKVVAYRTSRYMDWGTLDRARPGPARLARETGLNERTVERHLKLLVDTGWLEQTSKGGSAKDGRKFASIYRGTYPTSDSRDTGTSDSADTGRGTRLVTKRVNDQCQNVSTTSDSTDTPSVQRTDQRTGGALSRPDPKGPGGRRRETPKLLTNDAWADLADEWGTVPDLKAMGL